MSGFTIYIFFYSRPDGMDGIFFFFKNYDVVSKIIIKYIFAQGTKLSITDVLDSLFELDMDL